MDISKKLGSTLLTVLCALVVLSFVLGGILTYSAQQMFSTQRKYNSEQAFYLAETAFSIAAVYLNENSGFLFDSHTDDGTFMNGSYRYEIERTGFNIFQIHAEGEFNGVKRAILLTGVRNATYAQFAFWAEDNGNIYFKDGEEFYGHIHTDSKPYFSGDPVFWDEFSTANSSYSGSIRDVTFNKGFHKNTPQGTMADADFEGFSTLAHNSGIWLEGESSLEFSETEIIITNSRKDWDKERIPLIGEQVIYISKATSGSNAKANIHLDGGELDGRITIIAENDIYINDHVTYTSNPLEESDASSALGLISGNNVVITKSAPNDINIHATIMATGEMNNKVGKFYVDGYSSGSARGFINLLGGIVQKERGAVGTFSTKTGTTSTGYDKRYIFDNRFKSQPPPYFPALADKLSYETWSEVQPRESV